MERAREVGVEHGLPVRSRHADHQPVPRDARVDDERVDAAPAVEHGLNGRLGGLRVSGVGLHAERLDAEGLEFLCERVGRVGRGAVGEGHVRVGLGEREHGRPADAARAAGDEGRRAGEVEGEGHWDRRSWKGCTIGDRPDQRFCTGRAGVGQPCATGARTSCDIRDRALA